jgi:hypothetical protein
MLAAAAMAARTNSGLVMAPRTRISELIRRFRWTRDSLKDLHDFWVRFAISRVGLARRNQHLTCNAIFSVSLASAFA